MVRIAEMDTVRLTGIGYHDVNGATAFTRWRSSNMNSGGRPGCSSQVPAEAGA